jgi:3-hydroxyacyl-[acyl-carrier-protein] dehydratase
MTQLDARRIHWQWLDRVVALDVQQRSLTAERDIGPQEWYLEHHYPGFPVVPGVFLIEAMAHALAVLQGTLTFRETGAWHAYVLAMAHEARFYSFVRAGETAVIEASLFASEDGAGPIEGRALIRVRARKIARARLTLHRLEPEVLGMSTDHDDACDPFKLGAYVRMLLIPPLTNHLGPSSGPGLRRSHG